MPRLVPLLLLVPFCATVAGAATIHVPADQPTIQAGIDAALVGDEVLVSPGTYAGLGNTDLEFRGKDIAVRGIAGPEVTIIDGEDIHRGFMLRDGETRAAVIDGFTIRRGFTFQQPGGGVYALTSSPTVINCIFTRNRARDGGGFACQNQSAPLVRNCSFIDNEASSGGGLWYGFGTSLSVEACLFLDNFASGAPGPGGAVSGMSGSATISDCTMAENRAHVGGGIAIQSASAVVNRCTIVGNIGLVSAGGILVMDTFPPSLLDVRNTIIAFNTLSSITCTGSVPVVCSDFYGNDGQDWESCISGLLGQNGNIRLDPLFCNREIDDYKLDATSPCAPGNAGACGQIGAWPVGCGITTVEGSTWGQIKHQATVERE